MSDAVTLEPDVRDLDVVRQLMAEAPVAALVLGSGLGSVLERIEVVAETGYDRIAGMRTPMGVEGHAGRLVFGRISGRPVLVFAGRSHVYQGVSAHAASYPVRLAAAAGATTVILTNAAGALSDVARVGELMLITDHINLMGDNPLRGWSGPAGGNPFVPMGGAYDARLATLARECAADAGISLAEGVYVAVSGPSYETDAEVHAYRRMGGDAVGMSTVPEVIVARALGVRVLGLSMIANLAGGAHLSHSDVLTAGERAAGALGTVLSGILGALPRT